MQELHSSCGVCERAVGGELASYLSECGQEQGEGDTDEDSELERDAEESPQRKGREG